MKTLKIYIAVALSAITGIFSAEAQEFHDSLDAVVITIKESEKSIVTFQEVHEELIEKKDFSFRKQIKKAKGKNEIILFNEEKTATLKKYRYLRKLRKAANRSDNVNEFENKLTSFVKINAFTTSHHFEIAALYNTLRANTIEGKLDKIGDDLTWL